MPSPHTHTASLSALNFGTGYGRDGAYDGIHLYPLSLNKHSCSWPNYPRLNLDYVGLQVQRLPLHRTYRLRKRAFLIEPPSFKSKV